MKRLLLTLIIGTSVAAHAQEYKSYVELQQERRAKADAVWLRWQQERAANEASAKAQAAQAEADRKPKREEFREHKRKVEIAAASAPKINVPHYSTTQLNVW
jgi:hypothetical protein